jgi:hypothetical protein
MADFFNRIGRFLPVTKGRNRLSAAVPCLPCARWTLREEHLASQARLLADQLSTFHGTLRESTQRLSGLLAMASTQFSDLFQIFLGICRRCVAF